MELLHGGVCGVELEKIEQSSRKYGRAVSSMVALTTPGWESARERSSPWFSVGAAPAECRD
jgi:hypothetical protein